MRLNSIKANGGNAVRLAAERLARGDTAGAELARKAAHAAQTAVTAYLDMHAAFKAASIDTGSATDLADVLGDAAPGKSKASKDQPQAPKAQTQAPKGKQTSAPASKGKGQAAKQSAAA